MQRPFFHPILHGLLLASGALALLTGCTQDSPPTAQTSPTETAAPPTPLSGTPALEAPTPSTTTPVPSNPDAGSTLISAEGIGAARLGMTLGELKQTLGASYEFKVESPFIVDFDAIAVTQNGKVQYYLLHLAGEPLGEADAIQGLMTDNPDYKTTEGVGANTLISQATAAYGVPTLSFNLDNEGREYARFERHPAPNLSFATGNGNSETAGIYPSSPGAFNETQQFKDDARIQSVLVVCLAESCN